MKKARQHLLTALGMIMLVLGIIGAVLPLLPTTPFLLAALACFSRSFPHLERWLLAHHHFGPALVNWRRSGAISTRAKLSAVSAMLGSYSIFLFTTDVSLPLQALVALVLSGCAAFVVSRPNPALIPPSLPTR